MNRNGKDRVTPVILSGGSGTRLWPYSRAGRPKQMLALAGPESMLKQTESRLSDRTLFGPPLVVASASHANAIEGEIAELGRLILEPCARNTAAAIALAALNVEPDAIILVLPSDHLIQDKSGFAAAVVRGVALAREGWIVTFGMKPNRADTGYGYIKRGTVLAEGAWQVDRFIEKPDAATAAAYLADGGYDWNGGIFLMRADVLIAGLRQHAPEIFTAVQRAVETQRVDGVGVMPEAESFAAAPSVSIDYALMEKAERIAVLPVAIGWSDIGSWEALHEISDRDETANAIAGNVLAIDSTGCLIHSQGPLVATVGVEDLIVVATPDAVLIVPKAESQRVKEIVDRLKAEERTELL